MVTTKKWLVLSKRIRKNKDLALQESMIGSHMMANNGYKEFVIMMVSMFVSSHKKDT